MLGIEAPLWSETVTNMDEIEYMTFPRLPVMLKSDGHCHLKDPGMNISTGWENMEKDSGRWGLIFIHPG